MSQDRPPQLYHIPAGIPFARSLAAQLLEETKGAPETLSRMRLLLPTRRACRTVREAFLQQAEGQPLLLPHLQTLGDVDEEELTLTGSASIPEEETIPPALSPLRRQILLAQAIMKEDGFSHGPDHAIALAAALGRLMDRIYTEDLDMGALPDLITGEFATHWEITLTFLTTLTEHWPAILASLGVIDGADRRNRLLNLLATQWEKNPPTGPVIAAGSTGSIPATARLLSVIAHMPQGRVVLPGLDTTMDEQSWKELDDSHPQATLKELLTAMGAKRTDIQHWPGCKTSSPLKRNLLASEIMRPAPTTGEWARLAGVSGSERHSWDKALTHLTRCDCDTPQEEARVIALLMRQTLENPEKTAVLVTPDRNLARRVATACRRWNITLDDTAGQPLPQTAIGRFLRLSAQICLNRMRPGILLSLLRHRLCHMGWAPEDLARAANMLEIKALRGPKPPPGIAGLKNRAAEQQLPDFAIQLLDEIETLTAPFTALMADERVPFKTWLDTHIALAESLAARHEAPDSLPLWQGDDGEAAALFLADLRDHASALPDMTGEDYLAVLEQLMGAVMVRPSYGTHPRLAILGQLEARLLQADLVILGGLNEGTWPPDPGHDPWLSRPMMKDLGLPSPERKIGLAAHDFIQGFCAENVVLTRARRVEGAPTVPARWLQRLDTVMEALGYNPAELLETGAPYRALVGVMDHSPTQTPCERPAPTPPVALRPRQLSVTKIETWLQDPYSIYARYVLKLKKLEPLEKAPDAADRGSLLHAVMERFIAISRDGLPANGRDILLDLGHDMINRRADDPGFWEFWWPRFGNIADWVLAQEEEWRANKARPLATEVKGRMSLAGPAGDFTLTVRADRIDRLKGSDQLAIIDYKTGGQYSENKMTTGESPQLPLEGLIIQEGGFEDIPPAMPGYLGYWVLNGGNQAGSITAAEGDLSAALNNTRTGLEKLIAHFDRPESPFYSLPDPDRAPRFNDYEHLARILEWTALDDAEAA